MGRVAGKVALVTGAASGLGRATAIRLAEEGARVMVTDWEDRGGAETVDLIRAAGGEAQFRHQDVSSEEEWQATIDEILATGLHAYLTQFLARVGDLGAGISRDFLVPEAA